MYICNIPLNPISNHHEIPFKRVSTVAFYCYAGTRQHQQQVVWAEHDRPAHFLNFTQQEEGGAEGADHEERVCCGGGHGGWWLFFVI